MAQTTAELIAQGMDVTEILTEPERVRLAECESIIKEGLGTFLAVGQALAEIHDDRLYKETHKDFRLYCKEVWDLGKTTAQQKINSYKVVHLLEEKMTAIGGHFTNERQIRPLTRLQDDDDKLKAAELIQERLSQDPTTKLTGTLVDKVVKEIKGETKKRQRAKKTKELDATVRLSNLFKRQCKVMEEVINDERNDKWKNTSKKEAVKWLKYLVALAEDDD